VYTDKNICISTGKEMWKES